MCYSKKNASSTAVPKGYYHDTKTQIAKDASKRVGREKRRGRAGAAAIAVVRRQAWLPRLEGKTT
jgi:hypothetical protein